MCFNFFSCSLHLNFTRYSRNCCSFENIDSVYGHASASHAYVAHTWHIIKFISQHWFSNLHRPLGEINYKVMSFSKGPFKKAGFDDNVTIILHKKPDFLQIILCWYFQHVVHENVLQNHIKPNVLHFRSFVFLVCTLNYSKYCN